MPSGFCLDPTDSAFHTDSLPTCQAQVCSSRISAYETLGSEKGGQGSALLQHAIQAAVRAHCTSLVLVFSEPSVVQYGVSGPSPPTCGESVTDVCCNN